MAFINTTGKSIILLKSDGTYLKIDHEYLSVYRITYDEVLVEGFPVYVGKIDYYDGMNDTDNYIVTDEDFEILRNNPKISH